MGASRITRMLACSVALGVVSMSAPTVLAEPDRDTFDVLVERLNDPAFDVRDAAQQRLGNLEEIGLARIEEALRTDTLSAEQRRRLLELARDRFLKTERAGLGVQFDISIRTRVVVKETYEQFPCHAQLSPGDIILEAGGQDLRAIQPFPIIQGLILSRDPGDTLPLVIRRGQELIELELGLGSFSDLPGARDPAIDRKLAAWDVRAKQFQFTRAPIGMDVPAPESVLSRAPADLAAETRILHIRKGLPVRPNAVGAGEPRGGLFVADDEALSAEVQFRIKQRQAMVVGVPPRPATITLDVGTDINRVQRILDDLQREIGDLEERADQNGGHSEQLLEQLERQTAERDFHNRLLRGLQAEAAADEAQGSSPELD